MVDEEDGKKKEETSEAGSGKSGGKPIVLLVVIGVQMFLIVGGVVAYLTVLKPKSGPETTVLEPGVAASQEESIEAKFAEEAEFMEGEKPLGAILPLDTFVLNLRDKGFLKVRIQIEFIARDIPSRFLSRQVLIRDSLVMLLSSKAREDVTTTAGKEKVKDEVKEIIDSIMRKESIEKVFFTEFVIR
jgi:flagellar protein FliL